MTDQREEQNAVLAVAESSIHIDEQFKNEIMQALRTDEQYEEMIQELEDPEQPNEVQVNDRVYKIKNRTLKVHERNQKSTASYCGNIATYNWGCHGNWLGIGQHWYQ